MPSAAPAQLTDAELSLVDTLRYLGQQLVFSLAQSGSGKYDAAVEQFQLSWNRSQALVNKASALTGNAPFWYALVVDGMYGPKTAGAVSFVFSKQMPTKASGIPTWYASNRSFVDSLAAPQDTGGQLLRDVDQPLNENSAHGSVNVPVLLDEAKAGAVPNRVPPQAPAPAEANAPPQPIFCNDLPKAERDVCWLQRHDIVDRKGGDCREVLTRKGELDVVCGDWARASGVNSAPDLSPEDISTQGAPAVIVDEPMSFEDTVIRAAPTQGRLPLLALGAAAIALGGTLYYFTRRGRRA